MLEPIRTSTNPEHDNRAVLPIKFDRPCLIYCKKPKASKSIITNNLYFSEASRKDPKEDVKTRCANEPPPHHLPLLPAHQRLLVLEKQKERKETQPRKKNQKDGFLFLFFYCIVCCRSDLLEGFAFRRRAPLRHRWCYATPQARVIYNPFQKQKHQKTKINRKIYI